MHLWKDLPSGPKPPEKIYTVIEIPKGSRNKYEFDAEKGVFVLDRVLLTPFVYSTEYGFIPRTYWHDKDPLDVLVLMEQPTFPGCVIEARPIGGFKMKDEKGEDTKIIAVPAKDARYEDVRDLNDLPKSLIKEINMFFELYKKIEGIEPKVEEFFNKEKALKVIKEAVKLYEEKIRKKKSQKK